VPIKNPAVFRRFGITSPQLTAAIIDGTAAQAAVIAVAASLSLGKNTAKESYSIPLFAVLSFRVTCGPTAWGRGAVAGTSGATGAAGAAGASGAFFVVVIMLSPVNGAPIWDSYILRQYAHCWGDGPLKERRGEKNG